MGMKWTEKKDGNSCGCRCGPSGGIPICHCTKMACVGRRNVNKKKRNKNKNKNCKSTTNAYSEQGVQSIIIYQKK